MPVILAKVHLLTGELKSGGSAVMCCGKVGWEDGGDEYTDVQGFRFEATSERRRVTCKVCRRSAGITQQLNQPKEGGQ